MTYTSYTFRLRLTLFLINIFNSEILNALHLIHTNYYNYKDNIMLTLPDVIQQK